MEKENFKVLCPNCRNIVTDPKAVRCPRCFSLLMQPGCKGSCSKCRIKGSQCS